MCRRGRYTLFKICIQIAEKINQVMNWKGGHRKLTGEDIIIDIPIADKDRLGPIWVVEKGAAQAVQDSSQGLIGSSDDWHNRVRTVRVFVDPAIDAPAREKISLQGKEILQAVT